MRTLANFFIAVLFIGGFAGCGNDYRDRENYGIISTAALNNPQAHAAGWGRRDCLVCHNVNLNVHQRAGAPLDPTAMLQDAINKGESKYCITCHSGNGL